MSWSRGGGRPGGSDGLLQTLTDWHGGADEFANNLSPGRWLFERHLPAQISKVTTAFGGIQMTEIARFFLAGAGFVGVQGSKSEAPE
jgi:hypothetical protein